MDKVTGRIERLDFDFEIEEEVLDDYELLEIICDIDAGEHQKIIIAFKLLLGEEQLKTLKDKIRGKCGHVSTTEMMTAFSEIMTSCKTTKK